MERGGARRRAETTSASPGRGRNDGPILPAQQQAALVFSKPVPITRVEAQQHLGLGHCILAQWHTFESPPFHHLSPPLQPLMPLDAVRTLAGHDVPDLWQEDELLHLGPGCRVGGERGVEGVEDGRVVVESLQEAAQEVLPVVAGLLLYQRDYVRGLVSDHS